MYMYMYMYVAIKSSDLQREDRLDHLCNAMCCGYVSNVHVLYVPYSVCAGGPSVQWQDSSAHCSLI